MPRGVVRFAAVVLLAILAASVERVARAEEARAAANVSDAVANQRKNAPRREVRLTHPNGQLKIVGMQLLTQEIGLLPDGVWTEWYESGQKKSEGEYVLGKRVGVWTEWHANGQKASETEYVDGVEEGRRTRWLKSGQIEREAMLRGGKRHGRSRHWHLNGQLRAEGDFANGKRVGRWKFWNADGSEDEGRSGEYVDGKKARD